MRMFFKEAAKEVPGPKLANLIVLGKDLDLEKLKFTYPAA